jgi:hypothetical protein
MHRSSESIASLAAALAKTQMALTNPEKSLTGTSGLIDTMPRYGSKPLSPGRPPASPDTRPLRRSAGLLL